MDNATTPSLTDQEIRLWWMAVTTPLTPDVWRERVHTVILFGVFCGCGAILNALPILFTFCTSVRKNNVHLMVSSLSTADFGLSFMFLVGQLRYVLYREQLDFNGCRWMAWFTFITAIFSFIFPPMIAVNRYIALYYGELYKRVYTTRSIVMLVIGSWLFSTIVPFIFVLGGQTGFDDDNQHCCIVVKYSSWGWSLFYWVVIIIPLIIFCDGTLMFCNYKIYKKLSDHSHVQTLKSNVVSQNKELFYFLIADMAFPILFHTTYHVSKFADPNRTSIVAKRAFTCLYLINSCVRGLVTLCMLRPYRRATKKLVCFWRVENAVAPVNALSYQWSTHHDATRANFVSGRNDNDNW